MTQSRVYEASDRAARAVLQMTGDDIEARASCVIAMYMKQAMSEILDAAENLANYAPGGCERSQCHYGLVDRAECSNCRRIDLVKTLAADLRK